MKSKILAVSGIRISVYFNKIYFISLLVLITNVSLLAQQVKPNEIEILHADFMDFNKKETKAQRLKGNVQFKHNNAIMNCDSAYFFTEDNLIDAYGHIHINQGDTLHLYGNTLKYDGNTKLAQVRDNVKLIDQKSTLTTNYLDYNMKDDIGYYINGGKIVNGENNLSSEVGYYYANSKIFYYRKNVVIINPKYVIKSDTLKYNTITKTAFFFGPTDITSKDDYIYCENGWYNTSTNISQFNKNAYIKSSKQYLSGDSLYYERDNGIGRAFHNIYLIDSTQKVIITGNYASYREKPEYAMVTDSAVLMQYGDLDTMFVHADTMKSIALDTTNVDKIIRAYYHVRIFKPDMQGKCDSLTYSTSDSTLRMFHSPVLWNAENQMVSDYIEFHMANQKMNTVNMYEGSFITSKEDSGKYNQIKGKKMIGYFKDNQIYKVYVSGNGQTIYYPKDKDQIIGMNKAICSDMDIYLENKKIKRIVFLTQPDATLYPLTKVPVSESFFKGFKWLGNERPKSKGDIFKWVTE